MDIKLINDEERTMTMKLFKYDYDKIIKEDNVRGVYYIEGKWKLYIPVSNQLKIFLKSSYEIIIDIYFDGIDDDERVKRIYSPSYDLLDDCLLVEKLNQYNF